MENNFTGKAIRNKREGKMWSQNDLARLMNCTPQAVSLWEKGKNLPSIKTLEKLANLFNCSKYELMGQEENELIDTIETIMPIDAEQSTPKSIVVELEPVKAQSQIARLTAYASLLGSLSDNDKEVVYQMIDALVRKNDG